MGALQLPRLRTAACAAIGAALLLAGCGGRHLPLDASGRVRKEIQRSKTPEIDQDLDGLDLERERLLATSDSRADTDGDGLGDYDEWVKYRTDPTRADSDGDGQPDSAWGERHEAADVVHLKLEVWGSGAPLESFSTLFQDARVVGLEGDKAILEVWVYVRARTCLRHVSTANREVRRGTDPLLKTDAATFLNVDQRREVMARLPATASDLAKALQVIDFISYFSPPDPAMADFEPFLGTYVLEDRFESAPDARFPADLLEKYGFQGLIDRSASATAMFPLRSVAGSGSAANFAVACFRAAGIPAQLTANVPIPIEIFSGVADLEQAVGREGVPSIRFGVEARLSTRMIPFGDGDFLDGWSDFPFLTIKQFARFAAEDFPGWWNIAGPPYRIIEARYIRATRPDTLPPVP